jgi:hypothetical protein
METKLSEIVFKYFEFFFSKDDLNTMFKINPLSHHVWLDAVHSMYSIDPNDPNNPNKSKDKEAFHYNIMHTPAYKEIMERLKKIKKIVIDTAKANASATSTNENDRNALKTQQIKQEYDKINQLFDDLFYYEQTYVYAHYIFNNIRDSGMKIKGGEIKYIDDIKNMTLDEFKDAIRDKIRELELDIES